MRESESRSQSRRQPEMTPDLSPLTHLFFSLSLSVYLSISLSVSFPGRGRVESSQNPKNWATSGRKDPGWRAWLPAIGCRGEEAAVWGPQLTRRAPHHSEAEVKKARTSRGRKRRYRESCSCT